MSTPFETVHFGAVNKPALDWRKSDPDAEVDEDFEQDIDRPADPGLIAILGFDPDHDSDLEEGAEIMNRAETREDATMRMAVETVAAAAAHDTMDAMRRLTSALELKDEAEQRRALEALVEDYPELLKTANRDPKSADVFEKLLVGGFAEGLQDDGKLE